MHELSVHEVANVSGGTTEVAVAVVGSLAHAAGYAAASHLLGREDNLSTLQSALKGWVIPLAGDMADSEATYWYRLSRAVYIGTSVGICSAGLACLEDALKAARTSAATAR